MYYKRNTPGADLKSPLRSESTMSIDNRWSRLPCQWATFMAELGHMWWGSTPPFLIDDIIKFIPSESIVLHDPTPADGFGVILCAMVTENAESKRTYRVTVRLEEDRLGREMYIVNNREHHSLLDAINYIIKMSQGSLLPRSMAEPTTNCWGPGSTDNVVQGVNDLYWRLSAENKFWGAVRIQHFHILHDHIENQPRDHNYGIVVRYMENAPVGHLFIVLNSNKCVRVLFGPRYFTVRRRHRADKRLENADAVLEYITRELCITLLPIDYTVRRHIFLMPETEPSSDSSETE